MFVPLPQSSSDKTSCHLRHLQAAQSAAPSLLSPPLPPPRLVRCLDRIASMSPSELSSLRSSRLQHLRATSNLLAAKSAALLSTSLPHCQQVLRAAGSGPNLGLISYLIDKLEWHDSRLLSDLMNGFPLVGDLPIDLDAPPGVRRSATLSESELWDRGSAAAASQRLRHSRALDPGSEAAADSAELWRQTLAEVSLGRMERVPDSASWLGPVTRRFAVRQTSSTGLSLIHI